MTERYSATIVGAGPTGLMLANLLGKAGVRTLLIETNPATVGEPRAVSIDDETLRVVQQIGLLDVVKKDIVSGYGSEYLGPDGSRFLKVKPHSEPYGHPRRNAFRQPLFEAQLRAGLARFPHVETRFECRAERFTETADAVRVALVHADGDVGEVLTDFLIGCDGSWSSTREALGYKLEGSSLDERWLIIDLENAPSDTPDTIVYCDPKRPGIRLPGPHDTLRYEFKLMPGESDAFMLEDGMIAQLLEGHRNVPGSRVVRKTVYHFHARIADHWGRERVWLAGDAAHLMPPFAGQGMNGGIRDAANLAWKVAKVVEGKLGLAILETYERERRTHIAQMIRLALRMGTIFGPPTALKGLAIRSAFRMLGLWPAARSYFAEMRYKPAPRFDHGFFVERQLTRSGIVGRMLPQPKLPPSFGNATLDALLGDGFALIGIDIDADIVKGLSFGAEWDALIERRLSLASSDVPELRPHAGTMLLIRPDRYVMARFREAEAAGLRPELDRLLRGTWPSGVAASAPGGRMEPNAAREPEPANERSPQSTEPLEINHGQRCDS